MTPDERRIRTRLRDDFPYFARKCLKIRTKAGAIVPLELNAAQLKILDEINSQMQERGFVRLVLPKARQHGSSTFIAAYFFWELIHRFGLLGFILTHEQKATANLFEIVDRYYEHLPLPVRPSVGKDNANQLQFPKLDSGYVVGTAGSKGVGRSFTVQRFHGSEVAFWPNAQDHFDGVMNAVPDEGSIAVLESTANGVGGPFWATTMAAMRRVGNWRMLFLPFYISPDYRRAPPKGWSASTAWLDYARQHKLEEDQLYWAYMKNADRCAQTGEDPESGPSWRFLQEYPGNVMEAFQSGGEGSFIPNNRVVEARRTFVEPMGPTIIGVDPARGGGDSTGIIDRQGRALGKQICERWDISDLTVLAARVGAEIRRLQPKAVAIDTTGVGAGLYDILKAAGFGKIIHSVSFGAQAIEPKRYVNRRAEIWDHMREWFDTPSVPVSIPDDDLLHVDLTAPRWDEGTKFVGERLQLEAKEHIKQRLGISPDLGDASALTFALPAVLASQLGPAQRPKQIKEWKPW